MRARYSAYTLGALDYIFESSTRRERRHHDRETARSWAQSAHWQGLEIIKTHDGGSDDDSGEVEFIVRYAINGEAATHHEVSRFKRELGAWRYDGGKVLSVTETVTRGNKVGRNAPCPCGSGKKFKKCCGA